MFRNKNIFKEEEAGGRSEGFTLIELLVVISIIGLLASLILVSLYGAQQKARDAKRLGDMAEMVNAFDLYFSTNKGYPSGSLGLPQGMIPGYLVTLPVAPNPPDGPCASLVHPQGVGDPVPNGVPLNTYYYVASGTPTGGFYPDYNYYFCLGAPVGDIPAGMHIETSIGVK